NPEDRTSFERLHEFLERQAYRLSSWRVAADEINYRRFFDVNELAALRMERADVFEATQTFALDLAAAGTVDGLRIDHPDGLRDPARYFEDLQAGYARRREPDASTQDISRTPNRPARPLYVVAEKIAAGGEEVPESWAIHGTTGYRFANVANGVLVDTTAARRFDDIWRSFTGEHRDFETLSREGKRSIIRTGLSSELNVLSTELVRIARAHRRTRDYTLNAIRRALTEVAACMAVYRTYVIESPSEQDIRFVHAAVEAAKRESDETDLSVFDFVERTLLGRTLEGASAELQARVLRFAIRYQQFTAPVAAKGVEDTAFYRYFPLSSLNEVGGEPATFGLTVDQFHEASADRALRWPHTMLATSTHDNKRSEDVRNRIDVLSEIPEVWAESLERWAGMNDARRQSIAGGASSPSRQDEYLFYQALLGTLPADGLDDATLPAYRQRIQQYMQKAVREAKSQTRWSQPDENYEAPLTALIDALLERVDDNQFLAEAQALSKRLSRAGAMNSISLMLLKYGSPGVPDLYQGNEIIDLSLVDPDNRRPVDYALRDRLLNAFEAGAGAGEISTMPPGLMAEPTDGRAKLWVIWRLLQLRRQDPELFRDGDYAGLQVVGEGSLNALAFSRTLGDRCLLIVAGRFFAADAQPPMSPRWPEARIVATSWPDGTRFRDALSGDVVQVRDGAIALSQACARLPGAALWRLSPTDSRRSI
ncbi:MAG: malto-oligosyltrehalose synthase, partial [Burkholderiaceae bacterium]